ncbi:MAG: M20/M25/M40 family metallo-hydrolase [Chloroflexi bacterium]|nr:M20/M25/M40 family metallo-hydrolase [Chloroflexota bacterium]
MIESQEVIDLVSQLVRIDSTNPWLIKDAVGEADVADYISRWLVALGLDVWKDEVESGRPNLVAVLHGSGGGKSLCLNAHLDTVGYALWRETALVPRLEGDRLYGLGAADDKGHCGAGMLVLKSLVMSKQDLRGDVWLALTIDEEGTSSGTMAFLEKYHPDAALVLEPFGLGNVTITHQGFGWLDIIIEGKAAHGCAPEIGVDAIAYMAEVITRLNKLDREIYAANPHPLNGKTVFHTGTIQGGTDYATYPDRCYLGIEIGTQPGETIEDRLAEINAIFSEIKTIAPKFKGEVKVNLARNPFLAQGHESLLDILSSEINRELGQPALLVGENAWGDAALFQEAGIPTLMTGAYGENFHAPQEWVSVNELVQLIRIIERTVARYCA